MRATTSAPRVGNRFAKQATDAQRTELRRLATVLGKAGLITAGHRTNVFVMTSANRKPARSEASHEITRLRAIQARAN